MERDELLKRILHASELNGEFTLRSGRVSDRYFDKYQFESDPVLLQAIAGQMAALIPESTELLAGLELGGIPLVTALSLETGLPAVFVRKSPKPYGTRKLAEGPAVTGKTVLAVEDVVTTGGQILSSVSNLRSIGAICNYALCAVERTDEGRRALSQEEISLLSVFGVDDLSK